MDEYVISRICGKPCQFMDDEFPTCESQEYYCSGNIAASVKCGAEFGIEAIQLDFNKASTNIIPTGFTE